MNLEDFQKRPVNPKLRDAIFQSGLRQLRLAKISNLPRQYISMAINGRFVLTDTPAYSLACVIFAQPIKELALNYSKSPGGTEMPGRYLKADARRKKHQFRNLYRAPLQI